MTESYTLISVQIFIQVITCFLSLFRYRRTRASVDVLLSIIVFLSLFIESIGLYFMKIREPSFIYHYIYAILNFSCIIFFYYKLINDRVWIRVIKVSILVFYAFAIVTVFKKEYFMFFFIMGSLNVAITILFYLRELLLSDKILNYKKLLPFWVSVGFLVYYLPSIPFLMFINDMLDRGLFFILNLLIIVMNVFIIYGLICSSKEEKY